MKPFITVFLISFAGLFCDNPASPEDVKTQKLKFNWNDSGMVINTIYYGGWDIMTTYDSISYHRHNLTATSYFLDLKQYYTFIEPPYFFEKLLIKPDTIFSVIQDGESSSHRPLFIYPGLDTIKYEMLKNGKTIQATAVKANNLPSNLPDSYDLSGLYKVSYSENSVDYPWTPIQFEYYIINNYGIIYILSHDEDYFFSQSMTLLDKTRYNK